MSNTAPSFLFITLLFGGKLIRTGFGRFWKNRKTRLTINCKLSSHRTSPSIWSPALLVRRLNLSQEHILLSVPRFLMEGKHKFTTLKNVPAKYLINISKSTKDKFLKEYVERNKEILLKKIDAEKKIISNTKCKKISYLTEKELVVYPRDLSTDRRLFL